MSAELDPKLISLVDKLKKSNTGDVVALRKLAAEELGKADDLDDLLTFGVCSVMDSKIFGYQGEYGSEYRGGLWIQEGENPKEGDVLDNQYPKWRATQPGIWTVATKLDWTKSNELIDQK